MNKLKDIARLRNRISIAKTKAQARVIANAEPLINMHDNLMCTRPEYVSARNSMINSFTNALSS